MAGRWKSYQLHDKVYTHVLATDTWNQYTRRGKYLQLKSTGVSFAPTDKHIPIYLKLRDSTPLQFLKSSVRPDPASAPLLQPQPQVEWQQILGQQPPWASRNLAHIYYDNLPQVVTDIQDSELLLIVSDGSTRCTRMTYGCDKSSTEVEEE